MKYILQFFFSSLCRRRVEADENEWGIRAESWASVSKQIMSPARKQVMEENNCVKLIKWAIRWTLLVDKKSLLVQSSLPL